MCEAQQADFERKAVEAERCATAFKVLLNDVVPHLKAAMQDTDIDVRRAAGATLHYIDADGSEQDSNVRHRTIKLGSCDPRRNLRSDGERSDQ